MVQVIFNSLCTDTVSSPLRKNPEGRGVCTQATFRLLHITLRGKTEKVSDGNCMGYESKVSYYLAISIQLNHLSIQRNKITLPVKALQL